MLDCIGGMVLYYLSSFTRTDSVLLENIHVSRDENGAMQVTRKGKCILIQGKALDGIPVDWTDEWLLQNKPKHPDAKYDDIPIPVTYVGPTTALSGNSSLF